MKKQNGGYIVQLQMKFPTRVPCGAHEKDCSVGVLNYIGLSQKIVNAITPGLRKDGMHKDGVLAYVNGYFEKGNDWIKIYDDIQYQIGRNSNFSVYSKLDAITTLRDSEYIKALQPSQLYIAFGYNLDSDGHYFLIGKGNDGNLLLIDPQQSTIKPNSQDVGTDFQQVFEEQTDSEWMPDDVSISGIEINEQKIKNFLERYDYIDIIHKPLPEAEAAAAASVLSGGYYLNNWFHHCF